MPKIPVYEQQVSVTPPNVATPTLAAPPASAFGAPISEAGARLGAAVQNASEGIAKLMLDKKQEEQEKQVFKMDADVRQRVTDLLHNKEADDKGKPKGLLNRNLGNATGVTVEFDEAYKGLRDEVLGGELSDFQRNAMEKLLNNHYSSTRETLIKHEAREGEADYKMSLESDLKQIVSDSAGIEDPAKLQTHLTDALALLDIAQNRMGLPESTRKEQREALMAGVMESNLKGMIDTNPALARQMLSNFAPTKDGKGGGFVLPAEVYEALDSKILDSEFVAKLVQARDKGADKVEAMKMAEDGYFSRTPLEKTARQEAVNKLYATTDFETYMGLWKRVQTGQTNEAEIANAFRLGRITQANATELTKDLLTVRGKGSSLPPAIKLVMDQIEIEAEKKYANKQDGKGQKLQDQYLFVVSQKAKATQDPAELMKYAMDLQKSVKVTDGWLFFDTYKPGFEVSYEQQKGKLLELGTLKSMVGDDVLNGISRSIIATTGKTEVGVNDLGAFTAELGKLLAQKPTDQVPSDVPIERKNTPQTNQSLSFDIMAQGTPVNNAIRSLLSHKKAVTPAAVKAVLDLYPDGNWR